MLRVKYGVWCANGGGGDMCTEGGGCLVGEGGFVHLDEGVKYFRRSIMLFWSRYLS